MRKWLYCGGVCLCCAACTVGPDYKSSAVYSPQTVDAELNIKLAQSVPQNWYKKLNDERLEQLIAAGLRHNTDIKTAISRIEQARATLQIDKTAYLPQISGQGSYNYQKADNNVGTAATARYYKAGFDASWELDLWGKGRRQTEADEATLNAMQYNLENARLSVAAEIAFDYINLLQNVENLRFARHNQKLQQEIFASVYAKYKNGLSDEMAYEQSAFLLENTKAQISAYQTQIENYKNALAVLIGMLPSKIDIDENLSSPLFAANSADYRQQILHLPANVVRLRPDVAAAEENLIAQNALVGKAVAELYPDVSISGLWGFAAQKTDNLFNSGNKQYSYEPLVTLPLLDWNRLQNNVRLQKYIRDEALLNYKQTVLNALSEIKNTSYAYLETLESNKHKLRALHNMQKTVRLAQDKYNNGLIEFSDVLSAQQNLISAQENYVAGRADEWQNLIAYYKAVAAPINSN